MQANNQYEVNENVQSIAQYFPTVQDLNWPWLYKQEDDTWNQFNCDDCILIESRYQLFSGLL